MTAGRRALVPTVIRLPFVGLATRSIAIVIIGSQRCARVRSVTVKRFLQPSNLRRLFLMEWCVHRAGAL